MLEVADTGRGIPEGDLPHVTEPFFTSRPILEGRGLGLSIVHGIVASYRGGLLIDTVPGAGFARPGLPSGGRGCLAGRPARRATLLLGVLVLGIVHELHHGRRANLDLPIEDP